MTESVLTYANLLTFLRMLLVPVFALCLLYGRPGWALVSFMVAAATDMLDGFVARKGGQTTSIGAWLDPMADKLLIITTFVMLTVPGLDLKNRLPVWLTVLVVSRDIGIVLTVAVWNLAVARRTFRPSMLGKVTTAVYLMTCTMALYENYLGESSAIVPILIYTSLGLTVASAAHYAWRMMKA